MSEKCGICGKLATKLCDFVLARKVKGLWEKRTCDKPLCDAHATVVGAGFACVRSGPEKGCHPVTTDFCPGHAKYYEVTGKGMEVVS